MPPVLWGPAVGRIPRDSAARAIMGPSLAGVQEARRERSVNRSVPISFPPARRRKPRKTGESGPNRTPNPPVSFRLPFIGNQKCLSDVGFLAVTVGFEPILTEITTPALNCIRYPNTRLSADPRSSNVCIRLLRLPFLFFSHALSHVARAVPSRWRPSRQASYQEFDERAPAKPSNSATRVMTRYPATAPAVSRSFPAWFRPSTAARAATRGIPEDTELLGRRCRREVRCVSERGSERR